MPREELELDNEARELLERVRDEFGLEGLDQAAEMMLRRRLRRGTRELTGRGRAMHLIKGGDR
ncbi:MAG: hypothetical protein JJU06_13310 [Ectothiorhodospiraceae bacterium]|nr:hypothetical protein [Ectothiorhodospiraceae bacterium]